jgi:hypothetical protein
MSRIVIVILIYHRHKHIELIRPSILCKFESIQLVDRASSSGHIINQSVSSFRLLSIKDSITISSDVTAIKIRLTGGPTFSVSLQKQGNHCYILVHMSDSHQLYTGCEVLTALVMKRCAAR